jgi:hypothetical protein
MEIYNSYGEPVGLNVEVGEDGVRSFNISLMNFTLKKANSEIMDDSDMKRFIKK